MATDPRIDAYIANSAPFARPILHHLRAVVLDACPGAEETIKWGSPAFVYQNKLLVHDRRVQGALRSGAVDA